MTRRLAIGMLSVLGANAAGRALAVPACDTSIIKLYKEYMELRAAAAACPDGEEEQFYPCLDAIELAITAMPSTCMADFAAKMLVTNCDGDYSQLDKNDPVWVEARSLVEGVA